MAESPSVTDQTQALTLQGTCPADNGEYVNGVTFSDKMADSELLSGVTKETRNGDMYKHEAVGGFVMDFDKKTDDGVYHTDDQQVPSGFCDEDSFMSDVPSQPVQREPAIPPGSDVASAPHQCEDFVSSNIDDSFSPFNSEMSSYSQTGSHESFPAFGGEADIDATPEALPDPVPPTDQENVLIDFCKEQPSDVECVNTNPFVDVSPDQVQPYPPYTGVDPNTEGNTEPIVQSPLRHDAPEFSPQGHNSAEFSPLRHDAPEFLPREPQQAMVFDQSTNLTGSHGLSQSDTSDKRNEDVQDVLDSFNKCKEDLPVPMEDQSVPAINITPDQGEEFEEEYSGDEDYSESESNSQAENDEIIEDDYTDSEDTENIQDNEDMGGGPSEVLERPILGDGVVHPALDQDSAKPAFSENELHFQQQGLAGDLSAGHVDLLPSVGAEPPVAGGFTEQRAGEEANVMDMAEYQKMGDRDPQRDTICKSETFTIESDSDMEERSITPDQESMKAVKNKPDLGDSQSPPFNYSPMEPSFNQGQIEPAFNQGQTEPAFNQGQTEPAFSQGQIEPAFNQGQIEEAFSQGQIEPDFNQGQIESSIKQEQSEPAFNQGLIEPAFNQGQIEPACDQGQIEPAFNEGQMECAIPQMQNEQTVLASQSESGPAGMFGDDSVLANQQESQNNQQVILQEDQDLVKQTNFQNDMMPSAGFTEDSMFPPGDTSKMEVNTQQDSMENITSSEKLLAATSEQKNWMEKSDIEQSEPLVSPHQQMDNAGFSQVFSQVVDDSFMDNENTQTKAETSEPEVQTHAYVDEEDDADEDGDEDMYPDDQYSLSSGEEEEEGPMSHQQDEKRSSEDQRLTSEERSVSPEEFDVNEYPEKSGLDKPSLLPQSQDTQEPEERSLSPQDYQMEDQEPGPPQNFEKEIPPAEHEMLPEGVGPSTFDENHGSTPATFEASELEKVTSSDQVPSPTKFDTDRDAHTPEKVSENFDYDQGEESLTAEGVSDSDQDLPEQFDEDVDVQPNITDDSPADESSVPREKILKEINEEQETLEGGMRESGMGESIVTADSQETDDQSPSEIPRQMVEDYCDTERSLTSSMECQPYEEDVGVSPGEMSASQVEDSMVLKKGEVNDDGSLLPQTVPTESALEEYSKDRMEDEEIEHQLSSEVVEVDHKSAQLEAESFDVKEDDEVVHAAEEVVSPAVVAEVPEPPVAEKQEVSLPPAAEHKEVSLPPAAEQQEVPVPPVAEQQEVHMPPVAEQQEVHVPPLAEQQEVHMPPVAEQQEVHVPPVAEQQEVPVPPVAEQQEVPVPPVAEQQEVHMPPGAKQQDVVQTLPTAVQQASTPEQETKKTDQKPDKLPEIADKLEGDRTVKKIVDPAEKKAQVTEKNEKKETKPKKQEKPITKTPQKPLRKPKQKTPPKTESKIPSPTKTEGSLTKSATKTPRSSVPSKTAPPRSLNTKQSTEKPPFDTSFPREVSASRQRIVPLSQTPTTPSPTKAPSNKLPTRTQSKESTQLFLERMSRPRCRTPKKDGSSDSGVEEEKTPRAISATSQRKKYGIDSKNENYKPGGGNVKITDQKVTVKHVGSRIDARSKTPTGSPRKDATAKAKPATPRGTTPDTKHVQSKIDSLKNSTHSPGGGNVKIAHQKVDYSTVQGKIGSKANLEHRPKGGDKKILSKKLEWKAESRVGSLDNAKHAPGGGKVKIETTKLDFKEKATSKVGSKDNIDHKAGGGDKKIETKKIDFKEKATSKVGSKENASHKPGGGDKKIESHKLTFKETAKPATDTGTRHGVTSPPSKSPSLKSPRPDSGISQDTQQVTSPDNMGDNSSQ